MKQKYSYIKPRKKSIFTAEAKLVVTFFSITIFMLVSTYSFLFYKDYRFSQDIAIILDQKDALNSEIEIMKTQIAQIELQKVMAQKIYTQNSVLKESITNLFDLVPPRITLSKAELLENGLILYGITPNKDVYNFMLQAPLHSIFHKTYSSFYPAENGWFRFVSTNYMQTKEKDIEGENNEDED
jgi:hypothetical protein